MRSVVVASLPFKIVQVPTAGAAAVEHPSGLPALPVEIAATPDGTLWYTTYHHLAVVRQAPDRHDQRVTRRPASTARIRRSRRLSDGSAWITEYGTNKITRISSAGVVTGFPIPTLGSGPSGITAGPDGAMWFTERLANKIGRITLDGQITEFPIPTAASAPTSITTGPDGALWFTESDGKKIGRIPTSVAPELGAATADAPTPTTANLTGAVNPNGADTTYKFEYGKTDAYGSASAAQGAGAAYIEGPAAAALTDLSPGTVYHYRLVATNANGTTNGVDRTFSTPVLDADKDGAASDVDCNDGDAAIRPGATDVPGDGIDQDCAGGDARVDADRDGVFRESDCNDADAAIRPGVLEIAGNAVDENCDSLIAPFPPLDVTVISLFKSFPAYTTVSDLSVRRAPVGTKAVVTCKAPKRPAKAKRGCAFKTKTVTATKPRQTIAFTSAFKKRRLYPKTVITLTVTSPAAIGKKSTYTVRKRASPSRIGPLCVDPAAKVVAC